MAQKYQKPDSSQTKKLLYTARKIDSDLMLLLNTEASQKDAVLAAVKPVLENRVDRVLEQMDIEQLNMSRQGLRIQPLREANINNVLQISKMTFSQICAVKGLGEQSAEKIRDTVLQIKANARKTARIRLDPQDKDPADSALVKALYQYISCTSLRATAKQLYTEHHKGLTAEVAALTAAKNSIFWLFSSEKKKEQALLAFDSLRTRFMGPLGDSTSLQEQYKKILSTHSQDCWQDFNSRAAAYYAALESIDTTSSRYETVKNGLPEQLAQSIEAYPVDLHLLNATLRNYQTFGTQYILHQQRVLLGDEMGLGKTFQAMAAMAALKAEGKTHFMVVCPASVLINWCREVSRHTQLGVTKIHGSDEEALHSWLEQGDVAVTTYESISRFSLPEDTRLDMLVSDESHYVKNPDTLRSRSLKKLLDQADRVLFMTGTPLENRVDEMCALVELLQPKVAADLQATKYISTAQQFRQQLAPVYLRRTREDVLQELPELIEKEQWCSLGKDEKEAYRQAVNSENFMAMRQVSWNVPELAQSSKANRLLELCEKAEDEGRKVIVFSFFRDTLSKVRSLLGDRCTEVITGSVSPQRRQQIVDEFNNAPAGSVLISQVLAGGTGLNIQSASVIVFCEPQIKPSIESQAISRAYRMGQTRDVLVYRLLCEDTVDEQMLTLLEDKQEQFDNFAEDSVIGQENLKHLKESDWIAQVIREEKQRLLPEA